MNILVQNPPNYETIIKFFKVNDETIFTYGDTIYNPGNNVISDELIKHEEVHSKQQGDKPDEWWNKYIVSPDFRLSQEVEAYQRQFRVVQGKSNDRNAIFKYLHQLAQDLSSSLYGEMISYAEALQAIKSSKIISFKV